jgi:branched-subunit amino acid aminotransferase/4-amino-4-deoxychorismate lyase
MKAISFVSIEELNAFRLTEEIEQAVKVQTMTPDERLIWLEEHWGRLQESANLMLAGLPETPRRARHFATFSEKNEYDQARELERARQFQVRLNS